MAKRESQIEKMCNWKRSKCMNVVCLCVCVFVCCAELCESDVLTKEIRWKLKSIDYIFIFAVNLLNNSSENLRQRLWPFMGLERIMEAKLSIRTNVHRTLPFFCEYTNIECSIT